MTNAGYGIAALIETLGAVSAASISAWFAYKAAKSSKPVGNGFTKDVMDYLRRIEAKVDHHIEAHADREIACRANPARNK